MIAYTDADAEIRLLTQQRDEARELAAQAEVRAQAAAAAEEQARQRAGRLLVERDEAREELARVRAALARYVEGSGDAEVEAHSPLGAAMGEVFGVRLPGFAPDLMESLRQQPRRGVVPTLLVYIADLRLSLPQIPDHPKVRGGSRKEQSGAIRAIWDAGEVPLLVIMRAERDGRAVEGSSVVRLPAAPAAAEKEAP